MPTKLLRLIRSLLILVVFVTAIAQPTTSRASALPEDSQPESSEQSGPTYFPMMASRVWQPLVPETLFGVQMYGDTRWSSQYFDTLIDSQASWVRNEISWNAVEPVNTDPSEFHWAHVDKVVGAAGDGNINIIMTVRGSPNWAKSNPGPGDGPVDPIYMDEYAEFVQALVERYDGDGYADMPGRPIVTHFEFHNEPDRVDGGGPRSGWGDHPDTYAQMLAAVYPAAKRANPNAQVLFGGIAYDWFVDQGGPYVRGFLDGVLQNGGCAYFDIMNFHSYPPFASNWAPQGPGLYEKTQAIRAKLQDECGLQKPIVISEAGMHSNDNGGGSPMTEELQAIYVVQLFTESLAADVQTLIWFMLYDPPEWYPFKNGLVTSDEPPVQKIAFEVYIVAERMLVGMRPVGVLTAEQTGNASMQAYRFRNDSTNRTLYVAWLNPIETGAIANLRIKASTVVASDIYGNETVITDADDGNGDDYVTVPIGSQPKYVLLEE